jgi:hypothetical protein
VKKFVIFFLTPAILIIVCLIYSGCKKDCGKALLPLTQTGKNIFACKINGECWIAEGFTDFGTALYVPPISGGLWPQGNSDKMNFYVVAQSPSLTRVELFIRNETTERFLKPGIYPLNKNTFVLDFASSFNQHLVQDYGALNYTTTDRTHTGWIEIIKLDSVNKIISGRFEFEIYNTSGNKTSKITDGRFDIKSS